jgi:hypothetical protein
VRGLPIVVKKKEVCYSQEDLINENNEFITIILHPTPKNSTKKSRVFNFIDISYALATASKSKIGRIG